MRASIVWVCALLFTLSLPATQLYWSGNGTTFAGAGTWDTINPHFGASTAGPFTTVWDNTATNDIIVDNGAGAGGSIAINTIITNNGTLTLNAPCGTCPAYTMDGTGTNWFTPGSQLSIGSGPARSFNSRYSGTITKTGPGQVTFNNANGIVTKFVLKAGTADFPAPSRFGLGPDAPDFITLDGGVYHANNLTSWAMGRQLTITANNIPGAITKSAASITLTLDKAIHGAGGGKLTLTNGYYILGSTGNDWNGDLDIAGSTTVEAGASGVIPDTCTVTLLASGARLQLGGYIKNYTITSGGSNYTGNPQVIISGGGGSGATAICTVSGGAVTAINPGNPGSGYTSIPTVSFSGANGSNAAAVANFVGATDETIKSISGGTGTLVITARGSLTVADPNGESCASLISGPGGVFNKDGSGKLTLAGTNTFAGGTFLNDGEIGLGSDCTGPTDAPTAGPLGAGVLSINGDNAKLSASGAARVFKNHMTFSGGSSHLTLLGANDLELAGDVDLAGQTVTFTNSNSGNTKISGAITNGNFGKSGPGTLTLTAANAFTNALINQGTLALLGSGSLGNSAPASNFIAVGATLDVSGRADGTLTIGAGQSIAGGGAVQGMLNLFGLISPGTSPGTLTTGPSTWNGGAQYNWQINNATAMPGADPGWDLVSIIGGLNLTASASNKITLKICSLTPTNTTGELESFNSASNYVWTIVTTTQGVTNFDPNAFALDHSSFSNSLGTGTFALALANSRKDIQLVFASVSPSNPPYSVSTVTVSNDVVKLTWPSVNGTKYQVIGSTDLTGPIGNWTNVGGVVTATGSTASQTDSLRAIQMFYRVQVLP